MLAPQFVNSGSQPSRQCAGTEGHGREAMIRKAAHLLARWRGLEPGPAPEDWLTAERQIDELLRVCGAALDSRSPVRPATDIRQSQSART
jgi:hypothetical protein